MPATSASAIEIKLNAAYETRDRDPLATATVFKSTIRLAIRTGSCLCSLRTKCFTTGPSIAGCAIVFRLVGPRSSISTSRRTSITSDRTTASVCRVTSMCWGQLWDFGYSEAMKLTPHGIDIRERQRARVRSIRQQNEDAPVFGVDPQRRSCKSVVSETV